MLLTTCHLPTTNRHFLLPCVLLYLLSRFFAHFICLYTRADCVGNYFHHFAAFVSESKTSKKRYFYMNFVTHKPVQTQQGHQRTTTINMVDTRTFCSNFSLPFSSTTALTTSLSSALSHLFAATFALTFEFPLRFCHIHVNFSTILQVNTHRTEAAVGGKRFSRRSYAEAHAITKVLSCQ